MIDREPDWKRECDDLEGQREAGFPALVAGRRPRVLVVEDAEEVGHTLARQLHRTNHLVHVVADGLQALELLVQEEPDVLLLDLGLPRMDGFKLLHAMRMGGIATPVVVLTGNDSPECSQRALGFGVRAILFKPTPAAEVVRTIDEVLWES